jgi:hypothetical protein
MNPKAVIDIHKKKKKRKLYPIHYLKEIFKYKRLVM